MEQSFKNLQELPVFMYPIERVLVSCLRISSEPLRGTTATVYEQSGPKPPGPKKESPQNASFLLIYPNEWEWN